MAETGASYTASTSSSVLSTDGVRGKKTRRTDGGSLTQRAGLHLSVPRMEVYLRKAWTGHVTEHAIVAFTAGVNALLASILTRVFAETRRQRVTSADVHRVLSSDPDIERVLPGLLVAHGSNMQTNGLGIGVYYTDVIKSPVV